MNVQSTVRIECLHGICRAQFDRSAARHARRSDFEGSRFGADARAGNFAPCCANHKWHVSGEAWLIISRSSPDGRGRVAEFILGRVGESPASKVLPADEHGPPPA